MVAQNDRDRKPSPIDGLTKAERQHLYNPLAYDVHTTDDVNFALVNRANGAAFHVICAFGCFWSVTSNTGSTYEMDPLLVCSCPDRERALKQGRRCKHEAAAEAVERYRELQAARKQADQLVRELRAA